jgi:hypothetical protein
LKERLQNTHLPRYASSFQKLKSVRKIFVTFPGKKVVAVVTSPIKILQLKGSIFFDTDHAAGTVLSARGLHSRARVETMNENRCRVIP